MTINEAAKLAAEKGTTLYRESDPRMTIRPTNSEECCVASHPFLSRPSPRWNPKLSDLVADDWAVTE